MTRVTIPFKLPTMDDAKKQKEILKQVKFLKALAEGETPLTTLVNFFLIGGLVLMALGMVIFAVGLVLWN